MKKNFCYAADPQGGDAAHQGSTGVENVNKSTGVGQALLYCGLSVIVGVAAVKVVTHFLPSKPKKHRSKREAVGIEVESPTDVKVDVTIPATDDKAGREMSIEDRIRQLHAEGKNYPTIAHELHVSILVISRALKANET